VKQLILLFVLCLSFHIGTAQPYISLIGETNQWRTVSCLNGCVTDVYYTAGDTLVDGNVYRILDGFHYIQGDFLMREDVQEKVVYMKLLGGHSIIDEFPLYDFSIDVGDTVSVYNPRGPLPENGGEFVLDSIVLRPLENDDHRFFYLHAVAPSISLSEVTVWVEGIGSLSLINTPGASPTESDHLGCAFKNGQLLYSDTDSIYSCGALSIAETSKKSSLKAYPNPTSGLVNLSYSGDYTPQSINLISLEGKQIESYTWKEQLDLTHIPTGFYFIQIEYKEEYSTTTSLLVN
jgi:hypothetical protein